MLSGKEMYNCTCNTQFHKTGFLIQLIVRTYPLTYGILAELKILKIGIHSLCPHIFRFNGLFYTTFA